MFLLQDLSGYKPQETHKNAPLYMTESGILVMNANRRYQLVFIQHSIPTRSIVSHNDKNCRGHDI